MSKKKQFAIRTPLTVKGGIRAQSARGGNTRVWWSRRWTEMMESFRIGARLGRGRNYAASGQVSELVICEGRVEADVQGAAKEPYRCTLEFLQLTSEAEKKIRLHLCQYPALLARILADELPYELETLFRQAGMPLFPRKKDDVKSHCSCPDYANPCKHLAAVYFLLGEAVSRSPRLLLMLRGLHLPETAQPPEASPLLPAGLPETATLLECYGTPGNAMPPPVHEQADGSDAALLHRLGAFPFWRGQEKFVETLSHLYPRAVARGRIVWSGDRLDLRREDEKFVIKGGNLQLKGKKLRVESPL